MKSFLPGFKFRKDKSNVVIEIPVSFVWLQVLAFLAAILGSFYTAQTSLKKETGKIIETWQTNTLKKGFEEKVALIEQADLLLRSNNAMGILLKTRQQLSEVQAKLNFVEATAEMPTAASQGTFRDHIRVRWTRPRNLERGQQLVDFRYAVWRKTGTEDEKQLKQVPGDQAVYTDTDVIPGVVYFYRIYRYPSNPANLTKEQADAVWLTRTGDYVKGWAGNIDQSKEQTP
jgi:hypothetical protein